MRTREGYKVYKKCRVMNLLVMFDAHAQCIDEYSDKNGFLAVRTMNEAPYCRAISYQAVYNDRDDDSLRLINLGPVFPQQINLPLI